MKNKLLVFFAWSKNLRRQLTAQTAVQSKNLPDGGGAKSRLPPPRPSSP